MLSAAHVTSRPPPTPSTEPPTLLRLAFLFVLVAACGSPTEPALNVSGTYNLTAVNGLPLPAAIPGGIAGTPATATSGTLVLSENAVMAAELAVNVQTSSGATPMTRSISGTYTVGHDTVYARNAADNSAIQGIFKDGTLDTVMDGVSFRFVRQ
jgi:hypothetical protein